jgi:hypothetical protein
VRLQVKVAAVVVVMVVVVVVVVLKMARKNLCLQECQIYTPSQDQTL